MRRGIIYLAFIGTLVGCAPREFSRHHLGVIYPQELTPRYGVAPSVDLTITPRGCLLTERYEGSYTFTFSPSCGERDDSSVGLDVNGDGKADFWARGNGAQMRRMQAAMTMVNETN